MVHTRLDTQRVRARPQGTRQIRHIERQKGTYQTGHTHTDSRIHTRLDRETETAGYLSNWTHTQRQQGTHQTGQRERERETAGYTPDWTHRETAGYAPDWTHTHTHRDSRVRTRLDTHRERDSRVHTRLDTQRERQQGTYQT